MNTRISNPPRYEIYPARYYDAGSSPTWFAWNNLTAADVQSLRSQPGFEGQQVYFHLNHPIRFVRLVGVVVGIDVIANKHILLSLDDSSGACIEVKTTLREVKDTDRAVFPSNTLVDHLDVHFELNIPKVYISHERIDVGSVVKAKGTLDSFRNTRQLKLERIWIIKDTNEEAKTWRETARWKRDVLSKPWVLSMKNRESIDEHIRQNQVKQREREKKRRGYHLKDAERKRQKLERSELKRTREAKKLNAGALAGSSILPDRITDS